MNVKISLAVDCLEVMCLFDNWTEVESECATVFLLLLTRSVFATTIAPSGVGRIELFTA